jgi:hypothetical protein
MITVICAVSPTVHHLKVTSDHDSLNANVPTRTTISSLSRLISERGALALDSVEDGCQH